MLKISQKANPSKFREVTTNCFVTQFHQADPAALLYEPSGSAEVPALIKKKYDLSNTNRFTAGCVL